MCNQAAHLGKGPNTASWQAIAGAIAAFSRPRYSGFGLSQHTHRQEGEQEPDVMG